MDDFENELALFMLDELEKELDNVFDNFDKSLELTSEIAKISGKITELENEFLGPLINADEIARLKRKKQQLTNELNSLG